MGDAVPCLKEEDKKYYDEFMLHERTLRHIRAIA